MPSEQCRCAVFLWRNGGVLQWIARWDVVIALGLVHVDVTVGIPRKVLTRRRVIVASVVLTAVLWKVLSCVVEALDLDKRYHAWNHFRTHVNPYS